MLGVSAQVSATTHPRYPRPPGLFRADGDGAADRCAGILPGCRRALAVRPLEPPALRSFTDIEEVVVLAVVVERADDVGVAGVGLLLDGEVDDVLELLAGVGEP